MKVGFRKGFYEEMEKAFGEAETIRKSAENNKHGTGKHYETITVQRKDGTVYQRRQEVGRKKTEGKGRPQKKNAEEKKSPKYSGSVGDVISFKVRDEFNGERTLEGGKVTGIGKDGVTVVREGVQYRVQNADIAGKQSSASGTISASSFNANDYKNQFTDPKMTNDKNGVKYLYSLLDNVKDREGNMIDGKEVQAMVEQKLNEQTHRMKKGDTQIRNMHDIVFDEKGKFKSGVYNDNRQALHKDVIKKILNPDVIAACKPKNGEKPKFVMFGGRGGSGKSWFTDKKRAKADGREVMFNGIKAAGKFDANAGGFAFEKQDFDKSANNFLILDADEIKNAIPEFEMWNAGEVHEESSDLMKMIKKEAMEMGLNVIIDGTMAYNEKKPDKVKNEFLAAKDMGYSTEAHYMFSPIQKSCVNAMTRFRHGGDFKGRLVPSDILLAMQDNEKSFDSVKDIVDDWSFRDNQNFEAKLISRKGLK